MRRLFPLLVLLVLALFGVAQAQDPRPNAPPDLLLYNIWVRPTAPAPADGATPEPPLPGTVTSAYVTIENASEEDVRLVGFDDEFAEMSMLHQTTLDDAGIARMRMIDALDIPAGETVQLAPTGYHAMLMNVTRDIYPGEAVRLYLTFEDEDGAIFAYAVGALATDLPPEPDTLIVANSLAFGSAEETLLSVMFDNRSAQADMLLSVESEYGDTLLLDRVSGNSLPFAPVEIPTTTGTPLATGWLLLRLDAIPTSTEAFPLTLTFASGKTITIAVPVLAGEAE